MAATHLPEHAKMTVVPATSQYAPLRAAVPDEVYFVKAESFCRDVSAQLPVVSTTA